MPARTREDAIARLGGAEPAAYGALLSGVVSLLESARRASARAVNAVMTAAYWEVGWRIVEVEQGGSGRAEYGERLIERLSDDLTAWFGRGFSLMNLRQMRRFYQAWPVPRIRQTPSVESSVASGSRHRASPGDRCLAEPDATLRFPLPWSHYVRLLGVRDGRARAFYEAEALCGGWSVRQLERQVESQFYERTLRSRDKAATLANGSRRRAGDATTPEEEVKDPFVLEFLGLRDEYSEGDLEDALVGELETFLLGLGGDFAFVGRQRRLRVGDEWYRVDLVLYHRRLRCLVLVDLKLGRFTHADAGQMHLYLNYAREHWTHPDENPPVGLVLCAHRDEAVAHYALEGLPNKVLAAEYRTALPDEGLLAGEVERSRRALEARRRAAWRTGARRRRGARAGAPRNA